MRKDLTVIKGTIAKVFVLHKDEIFEKIDKNDIDGCKKLCCQLLNSPSIKNKEYAENAKTILKKSKTNLFLSTLMTYMFGMKASI